MLIVQPLSLKRGQRTTPLSVYTVAALAVGVLKDLLKGPWFGHPVGEQMLL